MKPYIFFGYLCTITVMLSIFCRDAIVALGNKGIWIIIVMLTFIYIAGCVCNEWQDRENKKKEKQLLDNIKSSTLNTLIEHTYIKEQEDNNNVK